MADQEPVYRTLVTGDLILLNCPHKQVSFVHEGAEVVCDYCGAEWWAACYSEDDPRCKSGAKGIRK